MPTCSFDQGLQCLPFYQNILNTSPGINFQFHTFWAKILLFMQLTWRIGKPEGSDQQSGLGLYCLQMSFCQKLWVQIFRTFTIQLYEFWGRSRKEFRAMDTLSGETTLTLSKQFLSPSETLLFGSKFFLFLDPYSEGTWWAEKHSRITKVVSLVKCNSPLKLSNHTWLID